MEIPKCQHEACTCEAPDDNEFCGRYCEQAIPTSAGCACGHADCTADRVSVTSDREAKSGRAR